MIQNYNDAASRNENKWPWRISRQSNSTYPTQFGFLNTARTQIALQHPQRLADQRLDLQQQPLSVTNEASFFTRMPVLCSR